MIGSCLCQRVRFRVRGELGPVRYCHCEECRRSTGTAFSVNARVHAEDFEITSGRDAISEYETSPGVFRAFCSNCGAPVYARVASDPGGMRIRLGSLDEDPGVRAVAHVFTAEKAAWYPVSDDLPQHPAGAPSRPIRSGKTS